MRPVLDHRLSLAPDPTALDGCLRLAYQLWRARNAIRTNLTHSVRSLESYKPYRATPMPGVRILAHPGRQRLMPSVAITTDDAHGVFRTIA